MHEKSQQQQQPKPEQILQAPQFIVAENEGFQTFSMVVGTMKTIEETMRSKMQLWDKTTAALKDAQTHICELEEQVKTLEADSVTGISVLSEYAKSNVQHIIEPRPGIPLKVWAVDEMKALHSRIDDLTSVGSEKSE